MEKMTFPMFLTLTGTVLLFCSSLSYVQAASPPAPSLPPTPTPAPAPAPDFVDIAQLLTVAGPFSTFLSYLQSTKTLETFQNQANNTDEGITMFVPKDDAFKALKNPSIANLSDDQLKSLILYHGLPHYYSLSDFKNLSDGTPVRTFAGGQYTLNFTDTSGTVHLNSGWSKTKVSSSVHSTDPVAIYQVDKVLLPEAIFGTDIPPTPAPSPAPEISPAADAPSADQTDGPSSANSSTKNSGYRMKKLGFWSQFCLVVISGGMVLVL